MKCRPSLQLTPFQFFATDATHVSSTDTALAQIGLANAFANAANLAPSGSALTTTPAGNGTVPQTKINTLANILAACVDAGDPKATACGLLFSNALSAGSSGTIATDTATAAINIAHYPANNTTSLFQIPGSSLPYTPALGSSPNDFTISISFAGGGLNAPQGLAIDGIGNAWIANYGNSSVAILSNLRAVLSGTGGYTEGGLSNPFGIAVDASGNAWVANYGSNTVTEISGTGTFISGTSGYAGGAGAAARGRHRRPGQCVNCKLRQQQRHKAFEFRGRSNEFSIHRRRIEWSCRHRDGWLRECSDIE